MLGDEGDLADGVYGDRLVGRDVVAHVKGEAVRGNAVEAFVPDEGADRDDADGEGRDESGGVQDAAGAQRGSQEERHDDDGEAGRRDEDVARLDVGVIGDVED